MHPPADLHARQWSDRVRGSVSVRQRSHSVHFERERFGGFSHTKSSQVWILSCSFTSPQAQLKRCHFPTPKESAFSVVVMHKNDRRHFFLSLTYHSFSSNVSFLQNLPRVRKCVRIKVSAHPSTTARRSTLRRTFLLSSYCNYHRA